jgi:hypothetical protein
MYVCLVLLDNTLQESYAAGPLLRLVAAYSPQLNPSSVISRGEV